MTGVEAAYHLMTFLLPQEWRSWAEVLTESYTSRDETTHTESVHFPPIITRLYAQWAVVGHPPRSATRATRPIPTVESESGWWSPVREKKKVVRIVVQEPPPVIPGRRRPRLPFGEGPSGTRAGNTEAAPTFPPQTRQKTSEEQFTWGVNKEEYDQPLALPEPPPMTNDDDEVLIIRVVSPRGHTPSASIYVDSQEEDEEEDPFGGIHCTRTRLVGVSYYGSFMNKYLVFVCVELL